MDAEILGYVRVANERSERLPRMQQMANSSETHATCADVERIVLMIS